MSTLNQTPITAVLSFIADNVYTIELCLLFFFFILVYVEFSLFQCKVNEALNGNPVVGRSKKDEARKDADEYEYDDVDDEDPDYYEDEEEEL